MEYFDRAIEIDPGFPDIYFNLAVIYSRSGRPGEAARNARLALELDPMDNQAYLIYAREMMAAGRRSEAQAFLRAAADRHPDLPGLIQALGLLERPTADR
jgi:tetratricopeptide (TPR) repeat protein